MKFEMINGEKWSVETRLSADQIIADKIKKTPLFNTIEIFYDEKLIFSLKKGILLSFCYLYRDFYINRIVKLMLKNSDVKC